MRPGACKQHRVESTDHFALDSTMIDMRACNQVRYSLHPVQQESGRDTFGQVMELQSDGGVWVRVV
jgi:hypothetical protein